MAYLQLPDAEYDYSQAYNRKYKGASLNSEFIINLMLPFAVVALMVLGNLVCMILSRTVLKQSKKLEKFRLQLLGEFTIYSLLFVSYPLLVSCTAALL